MTLNFFLHSRLLRHIWWSFNINHRLWLWKFLSQYRLVNFTFFNLAFEVVAFQIVFLVHVSCWVSSSSRRCVLWFLSFLGLDLIHLWKYLNPCLLCIIYLILPLTLARSINICCGAAFAHRSSFHSALCLKRALLVRICIIGEGLFAGWILIQFLGNSFLNFLN